MGGRNHDVWTSYDPASPTPPRTLTWTLFRELEAPRGRNPFAKLTPATEGYKDPQPWTPPSTQTPNFKEIFRFRARLLGMIDWQHLDDANTEELGKCNDSSRSDYVRL